MHSPESFSIQFHYLESFEGFSHAAASFFLFFPVSFIRVMKLKVSNIIWNYFT